MHFLEELFLRVQNETDTIEPEPLSSASRYVIL